MAEKKIWQNLKIWIWLGLAIPSVIIFFNTSEEAGKYTVFGFDIWIMIPIVFAAVALWMFNENFVDKSDIKEQTRATPGPQEPFMPQNAQQWGYEIDQKSGEVVPKQRIQPPTYPQKPNYGGRY